MSNNCVLSVAFYSPHGRLKGAVRYDGVRPPWRWEVIRAHRLHIVTYWSISKARWQAIQAGTLDHVYDL